MLGSFVPLGHQGLVAECINARKKGLSSRASLVDCRNLRQHIEFQLDAIDPVVCCHLAHGRGGSLNVPGLHCDVPGNSQEDVAGGEIVLRLTGSIDHLLRQCDPVGVGTSSSVVLVEDVFDELQSRILGRGLGDRAPLVAFSRKGKWLTSPIRCTVLTVPSASPNQPLTTTGLTSIGSMNFKLLPACNFLGNTTRFF